ncbi:MAG: DUF1289 domain-containing protein [Cardiobacteriaceae bacterium]|nr:DUF1289 domain-containing protein [Cardiobacteriaceae bacterium]
MNQLEYFAIQNPCQQVCRFSRQKICQVCFRSIAERSAWDEADDEGKRAILRRSHKRRLLYRREAWLRQQGGKKRPVQQFELFPPAQDAVPHFLRAPATPADDDNPQLALFPDIPAIS